LVSALIQLGFDSLPVADVSSLEQHQIGQKEQIDSEPTSEAEGVGKKEAEIVLQECSICLDNKPNNNFSNITGTCDGIHGACTECVQLWLGERIVKGGVIELILGGDFADAEDKHGYELYRWTEKKYSTHMKLCLNTDESIQSVVASQLQGLKH
jgi:hypothetical protein